MLFVTSTAHSDAFGALAPTLVLKRTLLKLQLQVVWAEVPPVIGVLLFLVETLGEIFGLQGGGEDVVVVFTGAARSLRAGHIATRPAPQAQGRPRTIGLIYSFIIIFFFVIAFWEQNLGGAG